MDTLVIAGTDTVVGANVAASLADQFRVVGIGLNSAVSIAGCEAVQVDDQTYRAIRDCLEQYQPTWTVYCGPTSQSIWDRPHFDLSADRSIDIAENWSRATADVGSHHTLISSDAVFTGPWMFHSEACESFCTSRLAETIRSIEQVTLLSNTNSLIVRTNAFGWTPETQGSGWLEKLVANLKIDSVGSLSYINHATPILASQLAQFLALALRQSLGGLFHISGAERVNQTQFAERLAQQMSLDISCTPPSITLSQRPVGFGQGETSLSSTKIRRALGIHLPLLADGLSELVEQTTNGYCDRFNVAQVQDLVA